MKPTKCTKTYYDYRDCDKYIQNKYKYNTGGLWHWLTSHSDVGNGGFFTSFKSHVYSTDEYDRLEASEEVTKIYKAFVDEFVEEGEEEVEMMVSW